MNEKIKQIITDEKYCVLATALDNKPHCSLMAYAAENDCKKLYMVTGKDSDKYRNLKANDSVSLMIDTRSSLKKEPAMALTVNGRYREITDKDMLTTVKSMLLSRHPGLDVFLDNENSSVFSVEIESVLLLDGFTNACHEEIS